MISSFLTPEGSLALAIAALQVVLGYRFTLPRRGRDLAGVAVLAVAVGVTLIASRGLVPGALPWPAPLALRLGGAALLLLGLALAGASFKARLVAGPGVLPTSGPYARLRHPLHAGLSLTLVGALLRGPSAAGLAAMALAVALQLWLARADERDARRDFGEAWTAYAARTRALVPLQVTPRPQPPARRP